MNNVKKGTKNTIDVVSRYWPVYPFWSNLKVLLRLSRAGNFLTKNNTKKFNTKINTKTEYNAKYASNFLSSRILE